MEESVLELFIKVSIGDWKNGWMDGWMDKWMDK